MKQRFSLFPSCICLLAAIFVSITLTGISQTPAALDADAARGKALFERRCTGCHSLDNDKEGPRLRNVYGRKAGSVSGFEYSQALKSSNITWDDVSLDRWLTDPASLVPGNDMEIRVLSSLERADIVRFLRVSSGK